MTDSKQVATAHVIALPELHEAVPDAKALPVLESAHPLHAIKARLQVCVGEVEVTVGDLIAAREHQVLCLDRTLDQPVDLLLDGKVVAQGQLVAVGDHFAVRITALPVSLKLAASQT